MTVSDNIISKIPGSIEKGWEIEKIIGNP